MSVESDLADMPLLPRDADGPVFEEPWQAQAFAVVVGLTESGAITREEWADSLGGILKEAEDQGDYDSGTRYYDYWLAALERLVVNKNLSGWEDLKTEGETIRKHDHHNREDQLHDHQ